MDQSRKGLPIYFNLAAAIFERAAENHLLQLTPPKLVHLSRKQGHEITLRSAQRMTHQLREAGLINAGGTVTKRVLAVAGYKLHSAASAKGEVKPEVPVLGVYSSGQSRILWATAQGWVADDSGLVVEPPQFFVNGEKNASTS